jgi:hypothetical protein
MAFTAQHAGAVTLSPHGIGQALIYPYYTVNKNQDTLLSVTNASDVGKAIQVRFREGVNGRDAMSFVLLLGAHDTWTAAISQTDAEGVARIATNDTSCIPTAPPEGILMRTGGFDGSNGDPADGGSPGPERTREGLVELIVGGDIVPDSPTDLASRHPANGGAPNCPEEYHSFVSDLREPTGGIYGSAAIVNVDQGTFFAYNADALAGLSDDVLFAAGNPYPGPTLADASNSDAAHGVARAYVDTSNGAVVPIDYTTGIDAVSAVFMADAIYNDYVVSQSLGAETDWIVAFPTKQFYVDALYGNAPKAPFAHAFVDGQAPVDVEGTVFDREQHSVAFTTACGAGCPPATLPYEVNALSVGDVPADGASRVLGSSLLAGVMPAAGDAGNIALRLSGVANARTLAGGIDAESGVEVRLHGLPVSGFMVYNVINANAEPGVLANYSGAFPHRRTTDCTGNTPDCVAL